MQSAGIKSISRKLMRENAPKLFFVSIIYIVIVSVVAELQTRLPGTNTAYDQLIARLGAGEVPSLNLFYSTLRPAGIALALLLYLLSPAIDVGYMSYCMKTVRKQGGDYKDILNGFSLPVKVILISVLTKIYTLLWSMLFFIPAIPAFYRYRQAYYILLDDPTKGVRQCIEESKRMMKGKKLDLFLLDMTFFGWYMLHLIVVILIPTPFSVPLVLIWLTPYMILSQAQFYDQTIHSLTV